MQQGGVSAATRNSRQRNPTDGERRLWEQRKREREWARCNFQMASGSDETEIPDTDSAYEHLSPFYTMSHKDPDGKNFTFLCKMCPPAQKKQVRTSTTSFSNLKRHIDLKHPTSVKAYMQALNSQKVGKGMKTSNQTPQTQITLPAAFNSKPVISQQQVDKLIINYIVEDLQPLSKVENFVFHVSSLHAHTQASLSIYILCISYI